MVFALLFAFTSIEADERTHEVEGNFIKYAENETYNQYIVTLPKFVDEKDNLLYVKFYTNNSENATVRVKDYDGEALENITLEPGGEKRLSLPEDSYYLTSVMEEGRVFYSYRITYYDQPYSFLAVPAFIFTIIGVYLFLHGQMERRVKQKLKDKSEVEKEKDI